ncbi:hypothetical protein A3B61_01130 [Candidatus Peribacteria bacterium RIFCSPLOWO2_01_FULL_53_10]|nr:MAG: hypothetical protein A3B61_01130 [Candidatus Peribacteria bacterium RIFCSPLOWO2_01_FULL_53_10]
MDRSPFPSVDELSVADLLHRANVQGVRDAFADGNILEQEKVDDLRRAFIQATERVLAREEFDAYATKAIKSGQCFQSGRLAMNVELARYSIDAPSHHQLLPDEHSYRTEERPWKGGRTWYTREERRDAARVCAACPAIPLAHMTLLSIAQDALLDPAHLDAEVLKGDFISFLMRWNSGNTASEVVPAISIALLRDRGIAEWDSDSRCAFMENVLQKDNEQVLFDTHVMRRSFAAAKDFLFRGRFFYASFGEGEAVAEVTCPGKFFMRDHWNLQFRLYLAMQERKDDPTVRAHLESLRGMYGAVS